MKCLRYIFSYLLNIKLSILNVFFFVYSLHSSFIFLFVLLEFSISLFDPL